MELPCNERYKSGSSGRAVVPTRPLEGSEGKEGPPTPPYVITPGARILDPSEYDPSRRDILVEEA